MQKTRQFFLAAYFMFALLGLGLVASVLTILLKYQAIIPDDLFIDNMLEGRTTSQIEEKFEDKLLIKNSAVGLWGAINYGLFNSGTDKIVVGKNGWLFSAEEFEIKPHASQEIAYKLNLITEIHNFLKTKNIELVIAIIPAKASIYTEYHDISFPKQLSELYENFISSLKKNNISVVNIKSAFLEHKKSKQLFMRLDTHWTPEGSKLVADLIAKQVNLELDKKSFNTEVKDKIINEGDLEKFIPTGWFDSLIAPENEFYNEFITKSQSNETANLFADEIIPVTLIGTSYSAIDKWNFVGNLKTAFQVDILNLAQDGNGCVIPMADFLANTDFKDTKLVIWEIPQRFLQVKYDAKFPMLKMVSK